MTKPEKMERAEDIAKRFMCLDDTDKQYITGYMAGIQVERQKWEAKLAAAGIPVLELLVKPKLTNQKGGERQYKRGRGEVRGMPKNLWKKVTDAVNDVLWEKKYLR